jgi:uncharacterized protein
MLPNSTSTEPPGGRPLALLLAAFGLLLAGCEDLSPIDPADAFTLVADEAGLLSPSERERILDHHRALLEDFDIDYRVATAAGTGDLVSRGVTLYDQIGAGEVSRSGRGLLLLVDLDAQRVRLEVGHALEGVFTDAFVAYVENRQMVPFFAAGRIGDGILATTELIVQEAAEAVRDEGFDMPPGTSGSGGAGATAHLDGAVDAATEEPGGDAVPAGATPAATLAAYLDAMRRRDARPDLDIYSAETRRVLQSWLMTPAQMDNVLRLYRDCNGETTRQEGERFAVIRYGVEERACSPWFFVFEDGAWRLDLSVMQSAIRFGRGNAWRFADGPPPRYRFAFADWRFDGNGFPHER